MKFLLNKPFSIILLVTLIAYSVLYLVTWVVIPAWGPSAIYWLSFFGRKITPIFLLIGFAAVSLWGENGRVGRALTKLAYVTVAFTALTLVFLLLGYLGGVQFEVFTDGGNWNYIPCFEYGLGLILGFYFIGKRQGYTYYSFMLIVLTLFVVGFLYEFPVIYKAELYQPINVMHALFISPNIISLAILAPILYYNRIRFTLFQSATFITFFVYSILIFLFALNPAFYAFHFPLGYAYRSPAWFIIEGWLPRIPALLFMFSLIYGVKTT